MEEQKVHRAILILQGAPTPYAKQVWVVLLSLFSTSSRVLCYKVLKIMANEADRNKRYVIEEFQETELLVNITRHVLVPEHKVMTEEEKKELLDK